MGKPVFILNGTDYAEYLEKLSPAKNDLDADGSGRDVQNGLMYRTKITEKQTWEAKFVPLPQSIVTEIATIVSATYYTATFVDPKTGEQKTQTYLTSKINFGDQTYDPDTDQPKYTGMSFQLTER